MARQDTTEFLTAFAVGTVLGIGATLLLKRQPQTAKERLMRELKPYRKKMRRSAGQVARGVQRGRDATGEVADDAIEAGRELMAEFRDEVRRVVAEARSELAGALHKDGENSGDERGEGERKARARRRGTLRFTRNTGEE
jgi:gas vesicle protein